MPHNYLGARKRSLAGLCTEMLRSSFIIPEAGEPALPPAPPAEEVFFDVSLPLPPR